MELKHIGVLSAGKVFGLLSAAAGFISALFTFAFSALSASVWRDMFFESSSLSFVFGLGAFIFMPLINGILGFVAGVVGAALYNLIANLFGGLELTFR